MKNLRDAVEAYLSRYHQQGWTLEGLTLSRRGDCIPAREGQPVMWVVMGAGTLYTRRDGSDCVKVKAGQIGIAFYYEDGRSQHGVFEVRELWEEMTGERPRQLMLWAEEKEG